MMFEARIQRLALLLATAGTVACGGAARGPSAAAAAPQPHEADIRFMSDMIHHHAQAVLMARWAMDSAHGASAALRTLAGRIDVSQRDEIEMMQRWLRERGQTVPEPDYSSEHALHAFEASAEMPGMLPVQLLEALDAARGEEFNRMFLTLMIRHHRGALSMVEQLLASPGPRDSFVFRFAADVAADQAAEIERMSRMLAAVR